jgi:hypothetical protein
MFFWQNDFPLFERVVDPRQIVGRKVLAVIDTSQISPVVFDRHSFLFGQSQDKAGQVFAN